MEILSILSKKDNSIIKLVKIDGVEYVVKYYPIYSRSMYIELNILASCNNDNIIRLQFLLPGTNTQSIGIVMNKEKETLMDVILRNKYTYLDTIQFALQIANGLKYLHHNSIVHFDVKPENIMCSDGPSNQICKIIDFGASEYNLRNNMYTSQKKCTATHRAPEGFSKNKYIIDYSFDVWSFGIIFIELLQRSPMYISDIVPKYNRKMNETVYDKEMHSFITSDIFYSKMVNILPTELKQCLNPDPLLRPNIQYVYDFLRSANNFATVPGRELVLDTNLGMNYIALQEHDDYTENNTCKYYLVSPGAGCTGSDASKYYNYFLQKILKFDPELFHSYPQSVIDATFNLIKRLSIRMKDLLTVEHINEIIIICSEVVSDLPNLENYINLENYDPVITNDIIMASDGILFQF